ncbi:MAG: hypothetical protein RLZZ519_1048 [Bacteroidota bacterium]
MASVPCRATSIGGSTNGHFVSVRASPFGCGGNLVCNPAFNSFLSGRMSLTLDSKRLSTIMFAISESGCRSVIAVYCSHSFSKFLSGANGEMSTTLDLWRPRVLSDFSFESGAMLETLLLERLRVCKFKGADILNRRAGKGKPFEFLHSCNG